MVWVSVDRVSGRQRYGQRGNGGRESAAVPGFVEMSQGTARSFSHGDGVGTNVPGAGT